MSHPSSTAAIKIEIDGLEALENAVTSGTIYPTQMGLRKPSGQIIAAALGNSMITYGDMDADYSATGMFSDEELSFGIFIEVDRSMMLSHDSLPGDFAILPPGTNHFGSILGN